MWIWSVATLFKLWVHVDFTGFILIAVIVLHTGMNFPKRSSLYINLQLNSSLLLYAVSREKSTAYSAHVFFRQTAVSNNTWNMSVIVWKPSDQSLLVLWCSSLIKMSLMSVERRSPVRFKLVNIIVHLLIQLISPMLTYHRHQSWMLWYNPVICSIFHVDTYIRQVLCLTL